VKIVVIIGRRILLNDFPLIVLFVQEAGFTGQPDINDLQKRLALMLEELTQLGQADRGKNNLRSDAYENRN